MVLKLRNKFFYTCVLGGPRLAGHVCACLCGDAVNDCLRSVYSTARELIMCIRVVQVCELVAKKIGPLLPGSILLRWLARRHPPAIMVDGVVVSKSNSRTDCRGNEAGEYAGPPTKLAANQEREQNKYGI